MSLRLYGLKNCDSCKKARKALEAAGKTVTFLDLRVDGVSGHQIDNWLAAVGRDTLVNTRSTTWRSLSMEERVMINDADAKRLLTDYPTLIKRPVIETEAGVSVGWSKEMEASFDNMT